MVINMDHKYGILRNLPQIDELLTDERLIFVMKEVPRAVVKGAAREVIEKMRGEIITGELGELPPVESILEEISVLAIRRNKHGLVRLINGTGVILHTNLGRANLSRNALESVWRVADSYSSLEYQVEKGARGSRHEHVEWIITQITGAEAAMVVNNNAAATMLCLAALAHGKEVIVSRGELVEIGGSFRIPDIMEQSGVCLREVGTTNKTKISDYENAYQQELTAALMKVHPSNYRIIGFTQTVSIRELAELGKKCRLPVIFDMGSGLMVDLTSYGIEEPTVMTALQSGADIVMFSGDKLLGGPQGGVIVGKREYIEKMKKHPLARVVRVDKMTIAAMEATFREYLDMEMAKKKIPVLRMITVGQAELERKAKRLKECVEEKTDAFTVELTECEDRIGGGSAPEVNLPGYAIALSGEGMTAGEIERRLRKADTPVVARIYHDRVLLSVRTIEERDFYLVADALFYAADKILKR